MADMVRPTPGEWTVLGDDWPLVVAGDVVIANVATLDTGDSVSINGRLLAASKQMLEAMEFDPENRQTSGLSYLRSLVEICERNRTFKGSGEDDADAWHTVVFEVRKMLEGLEAQVRYVREGK